MDGLLRPIYKTSIITYTQPFITFHVGINDERDILLMLLWPELLWENICSLGRCRWEYPTSLDSLMVTIWGCELTGKGKSFVTPSHNAIVVHANDHRSSTRVYGQISGLEGGI